MSQKQQVYSKVDLLLHSTFADKIHCNCFGRWVRCEEQAVKWLLRGRSGSQCGSYTLSVGHIHLVWVIHTRVSNIHSVLVTYTRCWSYTLGGDHIHFVWVIHTWCQSYTLGVGHIHLVLVSLCLHRVIIVYGWSQYHVLLLMTLWNQRSTTAHKEPPEIRGSTTSNKG